MNTNTPSNNNYDFDLSNHRLSLNPPCARSVFDDLEKHLSLSLPTAMRYFHTEIGAGFWLEAGNCLELLSPQDILSEHDEFLQLNEQGGIEGIGKLITIAHDGGGNGFALYINKILSNGEYPIVYYDVSLDEFNVVSTSFIGFINVYVQFFTKCAQEDIDPQVFGELMKKYEKTIQLSCYEFDMLTFIESEMVIKAL